MGPQNLRMKLLLSLLVCLTIFSSCQKEVLSENEKGNVASRSYAMYLSGYWHRVSYDINGELLDMRYVDSESGSMDAGYTLHTSGGMLMEVELSNNATWSNSYKRSDFYLTSNCSSYPYIYHKPIYMFADNSINNQIETLTLQPKENKIVYFYIYDLFWEGDSYYYPTTPPYTITLYCEDKPICADDIDIKYDTSCYWEKYR